MTIRIEYRLIKQHLMNKSNNENNSKKLNNNEMILLVNKNRN